MADVGRVVVLKLNRDVADRERRGRLVDKRETSPKRNVLLVPSVTCAILNAALPTEHTIAGIAVAIVGILGGWVRGRGVGPVHADFSFRPRFVA